MKKLVYIAIALVVMFAANSCKEKKETSVISTNDSVEVEEMNDSTIYGVCGEGTSMHSLELCSDEGDTLSVFIDDADPSIVQGGLMAGDRIALLAYKAKDGEMVARKIINLTSLLGKWISLDKNFDLLEGGVVKNNVMTLFFTTPPSRRSKFLSREIHLPNKEVRLIIFLATISPSFAL